MPRFDDATTQEHVTALHNKEQEVLVRAMAAQHGVQYVDLHGIAINPHALLLIPEATARKNNIATFELRNKQVSAAITSPRDTDALTVIRDLETSGYQVTIFMTSEASLEHAWERYADMVDATATKKGVLDINPDEIDRLTKNLKHIEDVTGHITDIRSTNHARRISETLETMFAGALALRASDIHIEPEESGIRLRYRLNGVLTDVIDLERDIYKRLISRLKLLSGFKLNVKDEAQDGRFTFTFGDSVIEIRSSIIPGAAGESMVMRLLDPSVAGFSMEKLGIEPHLLSVIKTELARPNGLVITTGPTGSGKTTALYAFLRSRHEAGVKIITIENPVEYKLEGIVQTQTAEDYTFASGLRAVLRQDPDIIMVGEIRDREVAETAIHAAQTGHLVFSTLHTNSAAAAFPRLIDLGVNSRIIGSAINLILGQRLVRKLCRHCKTARAATAEETHLITAILKNHPQQPNIPNPITLYEPAGCTECNQTGYADRIAIFEAIVVDPAVEEAVIRDPREHMIVAAATPQKIPTMAEDAIHKLIKGVTSLPELRRVIDLSHGRDGNSISVTTVQTQKPATADLDDTFTKHIV